VAAVVAVEVVVVDVAEVARAVVLAHLPRVLVLPPTQQRLNHLLAASLKRSWSALLVVVEAAEAAGDLAVAPVRLLRALVPLRVQSHPTNFPVVNSKISWNALLAAVVAVAVAEVVEAVVVGAGEVAEAARAVVPAHLLRVPGPLPLPKNRLKDHG